MNKRIETLNKLREILLIYFNASELQTLCFEVGVDYDSIATQTKDDTARELIYYLERRDRIEDLLLAGAKARPNVDWEGLSLAWSESRLEFDMERLKQKIEQTDQTRREKRIRQQVVNLRPLDIMHRFKDRIREFSTLQNHVADATVRLVSVVGRGGMGKTALVSKLLADIEKNQLRIPSGEADLIINGILYLSSRYTGLSLERLYVDVGKMLGDPLAKELADHWANRHLTLGSKVEYLLESMQNGLYIILLA